MEFEKFKKITLEKLKKLDSTERINGGISSQNFLVFIKKYKIFNINNKITIKKGNKNILKNATLLQAVKMQFDLACKNY